MIRCLFLLVGLFIARCAVAQTVPPPPPPPPPPPMVTEANPEINDTSVIFDVLETSPTFPGGDVELKKYIRDHTRYPVSGLEKGIEGTVYIRFVVEKDGTLSNFRAVKEIKDVPDFTLEALRVARSMSHWLPGRMQNRPMRCYMHIPVRFVLPPQAKVDSLTTRDAAPLTHPQVAASFPGGDTAMRNYFKKNLVYPPICVEAGYEGTVYLGVTIETDGRITEITVLKEVKGAPLLTKEAIRIVEKMPRWIPGTYNGTVVRMKQNIPVRFSLQ